MDAVEAKQFLISRVVQEAESSSVPLSEIERKMLYFTELSPSLPDIFQVNADFERNYDSDEYEQKIAQLLKGARARDSQLSPSREQDWREALAALKKEDHYILVMVALAFGQGAVSGNGHSLRNILFYIAIPIGLVLFLVLAALWRSK